MRSLKRALRLVLAVFVVVLLATACSSGSALHRIAGAGWVDGAPAPRPHAPVPTAPNIVFVLTDDLSTNLLRFMPHVQQMQRQGVTFSNYFVTDSLCCPSRASILTGEFPHNDGVSMNAGPAGGFDGFLAHHDQQRTFATVLHDKGYETGFFGKYLNLYQPDGTYFGEHPYVPPGWSAWNSPNLYGYEEYDYTMAVGRQIGTYGKTPSDYLSHVLADKTSAFISASVAAHRPFMAELATYAPHGPFVPAPADAAKFPHLTSPHGPAFGKAVTNAPKWLQRIPPLHQSDIADFNQAFRLRAQDVLSVDRILGRLQHQLVRLGVADNTYVVFSSDNGLHLGEHDLRLGKRTAFDTDTHVPLVVTGPGVPHGRVDAHLASNIDLAPTFDEIGGATPPASVDGHSLLGLLHGQSPSSWRTAVMIEHHGPDVLLHDPDYQPPEGGNPPSYKAIRTLRYLYVEYVDGERELYDLRVDPAELHNVYASTPRAVTARLHGIVQRLAACRGGTSCWQATLPR